MQPRPADVLVSLLLALDLIGAEGDRYGLTDVSRKLLPYSAAANALSSTSSASSTSRADTMSGGVSLMTLP